MPEPIAAAELSARIAELQALKPLAVEPEIVQHFAPGCICFLDGAYAAVSPSIQVIWPSIEYIIDGLLGMLPVQHRLEYWRERIERGATLALAFADTEQGFIRDAGILNVETTEEGKNLAFVPVCTFRQLDLTHVARIGESIALRLGLQDVQLWTPQAVPIVAGYHVEGSACGFLQVAPVCPTH
jgi:hypothetical protein